MGFNPDEYLEGKLDNEKPQQMGFDPDSYLKDSPEVAPQLSNRTAQTTLENYGDTLGMGYLPQMQALAEKPMTGILNALTGNDVEADDYLKSRDANRQRIEELSMENPKAALLGKGLGIVNQAPLMAGKALQGASALQKIANSAKLGAAVGAVQNPGDEEGEMGLQLGDRLTNASIGAATGAVVQGGVESLPYAKAGLGKASDYLKEKAERAAFKALGPYQRDALKAESRDKIREIGRTLIDNGILKGAPSYETIAKRAQQASGAKGKELEALINELSDHGDRLLKESAGPMPALRGAKGIEGGVSRDAIAESIEKKMMNSNEGIGGIEAKNSKLQKLLDAYREKTKKYSSIRENENFKRSVGDEIKWDRLPGTDIPLEEQFNRELYSATRQGTEDAAESVANVIGGDMPKDFKGAKRAFGNLSEAGKIAETRATKDSANRFISPTDYLTGTAGAAYGFAQGDDMEDKLLNASMGASIGLANRTMRTRGNPVLAKGLDASAKALMKIPRFAAIAEKNPALFNSFAQRISSSNREGGYSSLMDQMNKLNLTDAGEEKRNPANEKIMTDQESQKRFIDGN